MKQFISHSPKDTESIAERFADLLKGGDVIAYKGELGAGKTFFTSCVCKYLIPDCETSSPTFAIVNDYGYDKAGRHITHFDMYRITSFEDLYSTGFFDFLDEGGIIFAEWSENIQGALPDNTVTVTIDKGEGENDRIITAESEDGRW